MKIIYEVAAVILMFGILTQELGNSLAAKGAGMQITSVQSSCRRSNPAFNQTCAKKPRRSGESAFGGIKTIDE